MEYHKFTNRISPSSLIMSHHFFYSIHSICKEKRKNLVERRNKNRHFEFFGHRVGRKAKAERKIWCECCAAVSVAVKFIFSFSLSEKFF